MVAARLHKVPTKRAMRRPGTPQAAKAPAWLRSLAASVVPACPGMVGDA